MLRLLHQLNVLCAWRMQGLSFQAAYEIGPAISDTERGSPGPYDNIIGREGQCQSLLLKHQSI